MRKLNFIYNNSGRKNERRYLRKSVTEAEKILWIKIRKKQLGFTFRRQYSIGPYIVDFYCPKKRLVIELDGNQHNNSKEYDLYRTNYFNVLDIKVIRFWNNEIIKDKGKVIEKIKKEISPPRVGGD